MAGSTLAIPGGQRPGLAVIPEPRARRRTGLLVDGVAKDSREYATLGTTAVALTFAADENGRKPIMLNIRRIVDAGLRLSEISAAQTGNGESYESIPLNADDATEPKWWSEPIHDIETLYLRTESGTDKTIIYSIEYS